MSDRAADLIHSVSQALDAGELRAALQLLKGACDTNPDLMLTQSARRIKVTILQNLSLLSQLSQAAGGDAALNTGDRERLIHAALSAAEGLAHALTQKAVPPIAAGGVQAEPSSAPASAFIAGPDNPDCFLSYARSSRRHVEALGGWLEANGFSVWFDKYIEGGARFPSVISARIDAARLVLVLWCPASIKSDWVLFEAARANKNGKLIPIRMRYLPVEAIPAPYPATLNILEFGDESALLHTLMRRLR